MAIDKPSDTAKADEEKVVSSAEQAEEEQTAKLEEETRKAFANILGVRDYFGVEAREFRRVIRAIEDCLDQRGFSEYRIGGLVPAKVFLDNISNLGERFRHNLVHAAVSGEEGVIIPPEGTMMTYNYIRRNKLEKAKVFYSSNFTRDEDPNDVESGKTRNFHQIGFEIFNYPRGEAALEAIRAALAMIQAAGLQDSIVRMTDKRLILGFMSRYTDEDQNILRDIMDEADDDPDKLIELYSSKGGKSEMVKSEIAEFIRLNQNPDLSIQELEAYAYNSETYKQGIDDLQSIEKHLTRGQLMDVRLLPFMAKSWDCCDSMMFDIRHPGSNEAIAGGGILDYPDYKPDCAKAGCGVGVTRLFEILRNSLQMR